MFITQLKKFQLIHIFFGLVLVLVITGCGKNKNVIKENHITWETCVKDLVALQSLPVLDDARIQLYSSHDRTGGNNDFNFIERRSKDSGWVVLADINGPGCIRRLWMTGTDPGHRVRIYIDGEKKPRIDAELDLLFGSAPPWTPPLAQYVNMCYYSYIPISFNSSVRIETMEPNRHPYWGPRRIFFQLGVEHFDAATTSIESYPAQFSSKQLEALNQVAATWRTHINSTDVPLTDEDEGETIQSGDKSTVFEAEGAGTITKWHVQIAPTDDSSISMRDRQYLLQDSVLRVYYDESTVPSIEAPIGDFFGNAWRKRSYGSFWITSGENGYTCRLPMPFRNGIRVEIENGSDIAIRTQFKAEQIDVVDDRDGYLHAEYRRSGPEGAQPHLVTKINGRGKYLGCFLGVTGLDQSWWILEGDEKMWVDGNTQPVWQGTGLEDYFNGGWYYRGSVFGALNGNFDRSPFRVAQFRHQHPDPVAFQSYFQMEFERMISEQTRLPVKGYFQSVAYWYLEKPSPVHAVPVNRDGRRAVENPTDKDTFMLQLVELERMNDFHSAIRSIDEYIERYPDSEELGVYRLRKIEYRRLLGEEITQPDYAPFLNGEFGEEAAKQAKILEWYYGDAKRALIGMNVNGKGRLILDGKTLMAGDHPYYLFVIGSELAPGKHRLAAQVEFQRNEPWVQIGVRMHDGVAATGPGSKSSQQAPTDWKTSDASGPEWYSIGLRDVPRGVPDAPYLGGIANAFVLIQSKSYPIRALDWGYHRGTMQFREDFTVPINGWPEFSTIMTGLDK